MKQKEANDFKNIIKSEVFGLKTLFFERKLKHTNFDKFYEYIAQAIDKRIEREGETE